MPNVLYTGCKVKQFMDIAIIRDEISFLTGTSGIRSSAHTSPHQRDTWSRMRRQTDSEPVILLSGKAD